MSQDATGGNKVTLGFACLFTWKQLPAQTAIMISEVMKFKCSDSCKILNWHNQRKELAKGSS